MEGQVELHGVYQTMHCERLLHGPVRILRYVLYVLTRTIAFLAILDRHAYC